MSHYLNWIVLNDGVSERVTADQIDASEEAAVIDRCLIPVYSSGRGVALRSTGYKVEGEVTTKRALLRLFDEDVALADIGVALHSRASPGLWRALLSTAPVDDLPDIEMPAAPWCAVRCYAPEFVLPAWFDSWTKTVGFALLRREGW